MQACLRDTDSTFECNASENAGFEEVKRLLVEIPVLAFLDPTL